MRILPYFSFLLLLTIMACTGDRKEGVVDQGGVEEENGADLIGTGAPGVEDITLTDMPATTDFPNATIDDWAYEGGTFSYETSNYEFGQQTPDAESLMCANSAKGQHVHLIIDNEPYIAKYEPTFEQVVKDGKHHILTFLSRSYHESIKTASAHRAVVTNVANMNATDMQEITEPMLFYSRPKGTYVGTAETENVMLDFYPVNAEIGDEYQVLANINGKEFTITDWKPYYIKGLPLGENTVTLTLMKGDSMVQAPLNPVRRTFVLEADPMESSK